MAAKHTHWVRVAETQTIDSFTCFSDADSFANAVMNMYGHSPEILYPESRDEALKAIAAMKRAGMKVKHGDIYNR